MGGISETCSVCGTGFEVQFRYQMEEKDGGFSFFCSQKCLEKSQLGGDGGASLATCDACAKRFSPQLVSQVLYVAGRRNYACSLECRAQLVREAKGARLGDIAAAASAAAAPPAEGLPATRRDAPLAGGAARSAGEAGEPASPAPAARAGAGAPGGAAEPAVSAAPPAVSAAPAAPPAAPAGEPRAQGAVAVSLSPAGGAKRPPQRPAGVPRYLAVFNHKGGTGKTTTAVSVAAGLAARDKRVLLVDTDAQGNVSVSLGASAERSLYHVLVMGLRIADATRTVRPNLDLLPSNETLAAAELYLAGRQNRDRVLSDRLSAAAAEYDYVVLDCSPSLSLMNQNALVFADSVLVPVACDYLSLVGVRQVIKTVKNVNALLHHPVQIWGVLPTFFDGRAKIAREAVGTMKQHFGERCLAPIRQAIKVKEAPAQGQTIFEYAPGTPAADDYLAVVDRIIESRERGVTGSEAGAARDAGSWSIDRADAAAERPGAAAAGA
ncbi:ParA family protein [Sorangium sp. So ce341]|uniref:ParA family protein n=1 Tax=Sorangium sp. So ce341 TaxID=3133302 RepID=UPI003F61772F